MPASFRPLPIVLALAALPLVAHAEPRVLFCQGECFAVDDQGVRRPAPKGTELRPGERFETGPNTYAQIRVAPDADVGLGESGRLRIDQTTFKDRDVLILDQGRMRAVSGDAVGKPSAKPIELRTSDGIFAIRNADVEAKKLDNVAGAPGLTYVKPNAGNVALITGNSQTPLGNQGVQGVTTGRIVTGETFNLREVSLPAAAAPASAAPGTAAGARAVAAVPVGNLPALPAIAAAPAATAAGNQNLLPLSNSPASRLLTQLNTPTVTNSPSAVNAAATQVPAAPLAWQTLTTQVNNAVAASGGAAGSGAPTAPGAAPSAAAPLSTTLSATLKNSLAPTAPPASPPPTTTVTTTRAVSPTVTPTVNTTGTTRLLLFR